MSNETMANLHQTYSFSFTGASMLFHDFLRLANYVSENRLDISNQVPDSSQVMGRSNSTTSKREMHELLKRYRLLTSAQRSLLAELDVNGQKQIALLGICKAYPFIRDFIIEVVREKFLSLDFHLTDGDYQSFYNRKLDAHPELETFKESTTKKAKQVTFKILEEAGLIDSTKTRNILPQFVNPRLVSAVSMDNPALLKIFLMSDWDIKAQTT